MKKGKNILVLLLSILMMVFLAACSDDLSLRYSILSDSSCKTEESSPLSSENTREKQEEPDSSTKKVLVAYFTHSGNTEKVAKQVHQSVGGDIYEIQLEKPYPKDYNAVKEQVKQEQQFGYKPSLKAKIQNIQSYDVLFIGYPNWWGTVPMPVETVLSEYDSYGKTIIPFYVYEGSGLGESVTDIFKLSSKSNILDGLEVRDRDVKSAYNDVSKWLHRIQLEIAE